MSVIIENINRMQTKNLKSELKTFISKAERDESLTPQEKFWIASGLRTLGQISEAIRILSEIKSDDKAMVAVLYQRGIYKLELGDFSAAIEDFDNVMIIERNISLQYCTKGAVFFKALCLVKEKSINARAAIERVELDFETFHDGKLLTRKTLTDMLNK